jgi:cation diffusion facilitator family transporter
MNKRSRKIIRVSILGIIANLTLAGFKVFVGLLSNSIAIVLDAINNFSDSLSSIVTIIGTTFANKAPDKNHPMGHGRAEYLSTVIIGGLIIYIGLTALIESIKKIITPEEVNYQAATIVVVIAAIVIKIALGIYVYCRGEKLNSSSLAGSGIDAIYDAFISAATLIAIIMFFVTGVSIEPYLAAAISLFILRSGVKLVKESFSTILGERADPDLTRRIKADIAKTDGVNGAFDLIVHNYGNDFVLASVNVEVGDKLTASEIDVLSRTIQKKIYKKYHVIINSVGIYAIDMHDIEKEKLWRKVNEVREKYDRILEIHGFYVDLRNHDISFDIVIDFTTKDRRAYYLRFCREVEAAIPDYSINVALDADVSD